MISWKTGFDDEELPLRKEERFEQFVVDFGGDEDRARQNMTIEETAFETHKDFTQLLTDAAMKPESANASISTQKFAFALSRDWITDAYNDLVAQNRMKIPNEIEINVDSFNDVTTDGQNEDELITKFNDLVDSEKKKALERCALSGFEKFCLFGGLAIAVLGVIMAVTGHGFVGVIAAIAGIAMIIYHFSKKKNVRTNIENLTSQFEKKRTDGCQIIRATLAEVVDFRIEFEEKDSESEQVLDVLSQISPEQYVRKIAQTSRRIKM